MRPGWTATDRQVVALALPALGALVAEPLFLLVDTAYVGHLGASSLAALGIAGAVVATVVGLSVFLAYGTTGHVARRLGAGQPAAALRAGVDACWLAIGLGTAVGAALIVLAPSLVDVFDPPAGVASSATTYLRISAFGLPGMLVVLSGFGVLRGLQDTVTPLRVAVGGFAANAVLNGILIYPAGMGLAGAATGTVLAQTGMAVVLLRWITRAARAGGVSWRPRRSGVVTSGRTGLPLLVRTLAMRAALLVATALAAGIGTVSLAAHHAALAVWTLLAMVLDALAIAAQAMVGTSLGAGDADGARRVGLRLVAWGVVCGTALGVMLWLSRGLISTLLTDEDAVREQLVSVLGVAALLQPLAGVVFALDGVLIGAGDGVYLAVAAVAATVVFVPVATAATGVGGQTEPLTLLWLSVGAWMAVRGVTLGWRVRSRRWLVVGVAGD